MLVIFLLLASIGFSTYVKIIRKAEAVQRSQTLPSFRFTKQQGGHFSKNDIDPNAKRLILNFFNPGCDHCQYMAEQIQLHRSQFSETQLLLVTLADSAAVAAYARKYGLEHDKNIVFLRDSRFEF